MTAVFLPCSIYMDREIFKTNNSSLIYSYYYSSGSSNSSCNCSCSSSGINMQQYKIQMVYQKSLLDFPVGAIAGI